jgi:Spy/CpxP family protein refolding chaperone
MAKLKVRDAFADPPPSTGATMKNREFDPSGPTGRRSLPSLAKTLAVVVLAGGGALAAYAVTAPAAFAESATAVAGGTWMAHMHGHTPEQMHAHFDQVLTRAGVDESRRQQIQTVLREAMQAEHADMHRYHASFGQLKTLLATPRIDTSAVARLRAEQDALALGCSRRISDTALQVAEMLTPAQRQALAADIDRMLADGMGHHSAG